MENLITKHIDIWTSAQTPKTNGAGRGNGSAKSSLYGIKKLRELILELAVRGKLVPQNPKDESASVLLEKIAKEKARLIKEGKIKKEKPLQEISEDEKPFELPRGWVLTRLGNYIYLEMGQSPPSAFYNQENEGIPFFQGKSDFGDIFPIPRYWCTQPQKYAYRDDILLSVRAPVGPTNISNTECCIGRGLSALRPLAGSSTKYLLYLMRAYQTKLGALATGTTFAAVSRTDIENLIIPLPPLAEQHRIVAKVDELMALCDQLEQQQTSGNAVHQTLVETLLAALTSSASQAEFTETWQRIACHFDILFTTEQSIDQLKQTILQLAVMGKLVPQDPNDEPASVLLKKIVAEKVRLVKEGKLRKQEPLLEISEDIPFELPSCWVWCFSQDIFIFEQGIQVDKDLQLTNVADGYKRFLRIVDYTQETDDIRYVKDPGEKYLVNKDSLVMVRYGASAGFIGSDKEGVLANNLFKIIYGILDKIYIKRFFQCPYFMRELLSNTQGAAMPSINFNFLNNLLFPLPPINEQHRIVDKVYELMALCDTLKARLKDAQTTQIQLADAIVEEAVG